MAEWRRDDYRLTDETAGVDVDAVHAFLSGSYWASGIPREVVARSVEHSLNVSLWFAPPAAAAAQVGFARVVTDFATVAYLADVYVLEAHRGRGLSTWMMEVVAAHPRLQGLRRWILLTRDAHGLYAKTGWTPIAKPDRWMEKWDPGVYRRG